MTLPLAITLLTALKVLGAWFLASLIAGPLIGYWLHVCGQARVGADEEFAALVKQNEREGGERCQQVTTATRPTSGSVRADA